jgi:lysophospholipase L1-like esterase
LNPPVGGRRTVVQAIAAAVLLTQMLLAQVFLVTTAHRPPTKPPPSIAVVGDAFAAGSMNRVVWPTLLAQRSGWPVSNVALPGGGFVADGRGGHAYTYQVDRAQAAHPRVIVIATGLADTGLAGMDPVRMGAIDAINKVKLGGQQALVIGPTWYETPVPDQVRRVSETVRKVAEDLGAPFLDALNPPWLTRDEMQVDLSGPNDDGQSVIADKIGAWLRTKLAG